MNFSLTQLSYIVAVDTYRHYVKAAQDCCVSQPTLSMQIKKMEESVGQNIFDRTKQPLVPTELGVLLIEQARKILAESEKINELVQIHNGEVYGKLSIGIIPTLAPYLLPRFIGDFSRQYPQVSLSVKELNTKDIISMLQRDIIDVGILVTPLEEQSLTEEPLFYEEFKVYMNLRSGLSKKAISIEELINHKLWLLNEGNCFRDQTINLCASDQINNNEISFEYESGSLNTLIKMVDIEGGATLIPELAVLDLDKEKVKQVRDIKSTKIPLREVSIVYSRRQAKKRIIKHLKKSIMDNVPQSMIEAKGEVLDIYVK